MKIVSAAVLATLMFAGLSSGANAQERLLLTSLAPAGGPHSTFYNAWAKKVNAASNGTLAIEVRDGFSLATFANSYERTMDDVIQIGWIQLALVAGKFPLSSVTDLPFMSDGGVNCAVASWRLYKSGLVDKEYDGLVPLWFGCLGQNGLHFSKPLAADDNLGGKKIRVASRLASQMVEAMGGTPISMTVENVYESLQRGTLDGAVTSWPAFGPQRFAEVTTYHLEVPIGSTASMFFMSRKKFDSLPEAARKALMDNSGEAQTRAMGEFIAGQANNNRTPMLNDARHKVVQLTPEQAKALEAKIKPIRDSWVSERGSSGDAIIQAYQKAHADSAAGR